MKIYFFIILAYNPGNKMLSNNITFLQDEAVFLLDNSVQTPFYEKIKRNLKGVSKEITNNKNLGYAGGMNVGMEEAFKSNADWVILLNQDVELSPEGIKTLKETLDASKPGIIGLEKGYLDDRRWTTILKASSSKQEMYISGAVIAIHKDVYTLTHGFFPDYFMYYEDVELSIRAKRAGFPIRQIDLPGIHHIGGESIKKGSDLHQYYLSRNHLLFVERNAPMSVKLYELVRLPKTVWEHISRKERGALEGIKDYIFRKFGPHKNSLQ